MNSTMAAESSIQAVSPVLNSRHRCPPCPPRFVRGDSARFQGRLRRAVFRPCFYGVHTVKRSRLRASSTERSARCLGGAQVGARILGVCLLPASARSGKVTPCLSIASPSAAPANTTSRASTSRFRATSSWSSPGCPARARARSRSTPSTPRASAATSSRSRHMRGSSSARWTSPTSTTSRGCRRRSRSTRRRPRRTRARRSGTVTEIYDYLRLLYARIGIPHCPICGRAIKRQTPDQIVDRILELAEGTKFQVLAPVVKGRKGEYGKLFDDLKREGFTRVRVDGEVRALDEEIVLDKKYKHDIDVVVDRLVMKDGIRTRLADSVETALRLADGHRARRGRRRRRAVVLAGARVPGARHLDGRARAARLLVQRARTAPVRTAPGLGQRLEADPHARRARRRRCSLAEGAIAPFTPGMNYYPQLVAAVRPSTSASDGRHAVARAAQRTCRRRCSTASATSASASTTSRATGARRTGTRATRVRCRASCAATRSPSPRT